MEKLASSEAAAQDPTNFMGTWELGQPCRAAQIEAGELSLWIPKLASHWLCAAPGKGHDLGEVVPVAQSRSQWQLQQLLPGPAPGGEWTDPKRGSRWILIVTTPRDMGPSQEKGWREGVDGEKESISGRRGSMSQTGTESGKMFVCWAATCWGEQGGRWGWKGWGGAWCVCMVGSCPCLTFQRASLFLPFQNLCSSKSLCPQALT